MTRLTHAWRELEREQRLAALTSLGLFVSMFLPWYSKANTFVEHGAAKATQTSLSAFQAFSFVEAAVLLVSAGVLTLLFRRAEGGSFHLPGGDGLIVMVAGAWAALLIFYRLLDKPGLKASQTITATVGVEWGIFIALLLAIGLLYAGQRMRAEERPAPPAMRRRPRPRDPGGESPNVEEHPAPWQEPEQRTVAVPRAGRQPSEPAATEARGTRPVPARAERNDQPDDEPRRRHESPPQAAVAPPRPTSKRPRFPPAPPSQQMSFEDPAPPSPPATD